MNFFSRASALWVFGFALSLPGATSLAQTTVAGFTSGSFRVTESGAANYTIPIQIPPGVAGMQPALALSYSSQAGNGLLGVGWRMEGFSAISRCPRTVAQDTVAGSVNYDANDRFCLDGQRLINVSGAYGANGTQYRTERESFAKVISNGSAGSGPASFTVWTKSGQVIEYGNTADSRIEAQGRAEARTWAANKVSDTKGNYFTVSYTENTSVGDFYPVRVDYTGNTGATLSTFASVRFEYATRSDAAPVYVAGSVITTQKRLTSIKTYVGETLVRDYQLAYGTSTATYRSRLASVTECAADGACLKPHQFTWQSPALGWSGSTWAGPAVATYTEYPWQTIGKSCFTGDMDGDGRTDVWCYTGANGTWDISRSTGSGFTTTQATGPAPILMAGDVCLTGDLNGDGKTDIWCNRKGYEGEEGAWDVAISTGAGWTNSTVQNGLNLGGVTEPVVAVRDQCFTVDVNGDGRTDMWCYAGGWMAALSTGSGWTLTGTNLGSTVYATPIGNSCFASDLNGDGKSDMLCYSGSNYFWNLSLSTADTTPTWSNTTTQAAPHLLGSGCRPTDLNGDGKMDLLCHTGTGTDWTAYYFTGTTWSPPVALTGPVSGSECFMTDLNGDGRADMLCYGNNSTVWFAFYSTGNNWVGVQLAGPNYEYSFATGWCRIGDLNGDGKGDLFCYSGSGTSWNPYLASGSFPDLKSQITNSLDGVISLTHKPLTDSTVYTKDTTAVYPVMDLKGPMYVTSAHTASNGVGAGTNQMTYTYTGAKFAFTARGYLGFRQMQTVDPNGHKTLVTFRQDWPYIGLPSQVKRMKANNSVLSQTDNTYACKDFNGGCTVAVGRRYFPYVSASDQINYDLNGAFISRTGTTNAFDTNGNSTSIVVTDKTAAGVATGYAKTTTNTYTDNTTTNWFLGRLTRSTVLSTKP